MITDAKANGRDYAGAMGALLPTMNVVELWKEFHAFKDSYNTSYQVLIERLGRLEAQAPSWARSEDLATLRETVKAFKEASEQSKQYMDATMVQFEKTVKATLEQFENASSAMATKTDVDWLKRAYWAAVGLGVTINGSLIIYILARLFKLAP